MSPSDLAAYIGAAAWLPQIGLFVYAVIVKPAIRLIPVRQFELGYTVLGPIVNVRGSLIAENKTAVVTKMLLKARHERGRVVDLEWNSFVETFSTLKGAEGDVEVTRDQVATALLINEDVPTEKFIRFFDPQFQAAQRAVYRKFEDHFEHLKKTSPDYGEATLKSKEMQELIGFYRQNFCWEAGLYELEVEIHMLNQKTPSIGRATFEILPSDVERLRANIGVLESLVEGLVSGAPDQSKTSFFWANPLLDTHDIMIKRRLLWSPRARKSALPIRKSGK